MAKKRKSSSAKKSSVRRAKSSPKKTKSRASKSSKKVASKPAISNATTTNVYQSAPVTRSSSSDTGVFQKETKTSGWMPFFWLILLVLIVIFIVLLFRGA